MNLSYLWIGIGGAFGAIARVLLMRLLPSFLINLPIKILCVNIVGCFAIGILSEIMTFYWQASLNMRHFLIQGFLGGFTTFSAFALEYGLLYEKGSHLIAIIYAVLSVALSIACFFGGLKIIKMIHVMTR